MIKFVYKPVSILISVLGGILAGAIFKQVWKLAAGEEEAPTATDVRRGWTEVLVAATLQGAIFALVKAVLDRGTAEGTRKLTGVWPGDDSQPEAEEEGA
jgi:Protein of unknown function (DUF4235)